MKIRNGFISNSSSSSFIIGDMNYSTGEKYTKESVLQDIKDMIAQFRKNGLKNARREADKWAKYNNRKATDKEVESIKKYYNSFTDEFIDNWVAVDEMRFVAHNVSDWYRPVDYSSDDLVIMDLGDNIIPEQVAKKIIKKYNLNDRHYCLHMG